MRDYDRPELLQPVPENPEPSELNEGQQADELLDKALLQEVPVEKLPPERQDQLAAAFEKSAEIQKYRRGETTIDQLEQLPSVVEEQGRGLGLNPTTIEEILEGSARQVQAVAGACHAYGRSVDRFRRAKLTRLHEDSEKFAKTLEEWDVARRHSHEALISTLRGFNRFYSVVLHERYGVDVPNSLLIGDAIMRDREVAGHWALSTDYYLRARHLVEMIKKKRGRPDEATPETEQAA